MSRFSARLIFKKQDNNLKKNDKTGENNIILCKKGKIVWGDFET
jgi:hypothetical protein